MRIELEGLLGLQRSGDMMIELTSTGVGCRQTTEPQKKAFVEMPPFFRVAQSKTASINGFQNELPLEIDLQRRLVFSAASTNDPTHRSSSRSSCPYKLISRGG
jgi:hypothetical protein